MAICLCCLCTGTAMSDEKVVNCGPADPGSPLGRRLWRQLLPRNCTTILARMSVSLNTATCCGIPSTSSATSSAAPTRRPASRMRISLTRGLAGYLANRAEHSLHRGLPLALVRPQRFLQDSAPRKMLEPTHRAMTVQYTIGSRAPRHSFQQSPQKRAARHSF
jgi:hypothetical protein